LELHAFNFTVRHYPGKDNNTQADTLSRLPVSLMGVECYFTAQQLGEAKKAHPVLSIVINKLEITSDPTRDKSWNKFPYAAISSSGSSYPYREQCFVKE